MPSPKPKPPKTAARRRRKRALERATIAEIKAELARRRAQATP